MAANPSIQLGTDGNWAIKEDNLLAYKEDGTRFFNKQFDFTRGSLATFVDKDGLIKYSGFTNTELVTNGDFATDSNWNLSTSWSIGYGKATYDTSNNGVCSQNFNFVVGKKYQVNFEISDFTTDYRFDLYTGVSFIQSAIITNKTSFSILFDGDGGYLLRFRGLARGTGFSLDNVSVKEIQLDVPRIDFKNDTKGHLLLEPQSTNLVRYSEDLSQSSWTKTKCSLGNKVLSPNGTISAYKIIPNEENGKHEISRSISSYTTATVSLFAKAEEKSRLQITKSNWGTTDFDLLNKTVTSGVGTIEDYGNGWFRCTASYTASPSQSSIYFIVADNNGDVTYSGNNIDGMYFWGIQLEQQSYATSYIPTSSSTVTRNAEVCNNSGTAQDFNSSEGVLYAEVSGFKNGGLGDRTISINDGSTQNAIQLLLHNTANRINFRSRSGGSLDVNISDFTFQQNQTNKIACKFKSGDYALWVNGVERVTSTSSSLPTGLSVLSFDDGSLNDFYGKTKNLKVFKRAMSDGELYLLTVTQYQSYQAMATALNYTS